jgi:predicted  nucleic acid-binding Zn-ribbon protein
MSKKEEENPILKDFIEFRLETERRLTMLETSIHDMKDDINDLKDNLKEVFRRFDALKKDIDKYKWWVLSGFVSSTLLAVLLKLILGV